MEVKEQAQQFRESFDRLSKSIAKVIVGNQEIIEGVLITLFAGGHCLLEGVPGLGKTLLVRTLSQCLDLKFNRVQFTPDLMPADIIGTNIVQEDAHGRKSFEFESGPVFTNVLLADEINRATPKTQSALLEAMQEKSITVAGVRYILDAPFYVLATQNPIEMEGTYPLPEAQLDRFFLKLIVNFPNTEEMAEILNRTTIKDVPQGEKVMEKGEILGWMDFIREVEVAPHVRDYAVKLVLATHPKNENAPADIKKYVRYGSSPRGAQTLILAGKIKALLDERFNVSFSDIINFTHPALRHRIILNFEGEAEGFSTDDILKKLLNEVKPPSL